MAITGTKAFTSGEVLTANDVNQYLMRGVKVFGGTATRDAAYGGAGEPVLEEGEAVFLSDTDTLQVYGGTAIGWLSYPTTTKSGKVLQVVSTTKTDTFTTTSTSYVDITGLTATITPSSTSSLVLVMAGVTCSQDVAVSDAGLQLARGGTAIFSGTAAGSRSVGLKISAPSATNPLTMPLLYLDSPASTSALTYSVQIKNAAAGTSYVNRSKTDTDAVQLFRSSSTITVMEISA